MNKTESIGEPIMLRVVRSLLLQASSSEEQGPISSKEFYSGIFLVSGALSVFGLLIRIFGS